MRIKILFFSILFLTGSILVVQKAEAAACTVSSARWSKNTVKVGESIQMTISVQNPTDCSNQNIGLQIFESDVFGDDSIVGPLVKRFSGTSGTVNYDYVFTVQDWERGGSENPGTIYFTALPQNQSGYIKSNPIFLYPAQSSNGGTTITSFNVTQLNASTIRFTFLVNIPRPGELKSFCGADPFWRAIEINPIKLVRNGQFALDKTNYKFDFDEPGQTNGKTYQGTIICKGTDVAKSQLISCDSRGVCQSGDGGTTCGTSGQPACESGQEQTYSFEIPNPLKGGVKDLSGLVKILAQWIFNLAIPIAVAMIVYSGILFLTAAGEPAKITKARDVLKWAVVGLVIILIGSGFVTLIQSVLELGAPSANSRSTLPAGSTTGGAMVTGAVGNKCSNDRNCFSGLKCKNSICQRATGNLVGEACVGGVNCSSGLACDLTAEQVIDGQKLGSCFRPQ